MERETKVGNECTLGGGESAGPREGALVAGTPLGLPTLPRHGVGGVEVEEGH
jgi:hypothetical protein